MSLSVLLGITAEGVSDVARCRTEDVVATRTTHRHNHTKLPVACCGCSSFSCASMLSMVAASEGYVSSRVRIFWWSGVGG
jgi:hypothetical protein